MQVGINALKAKDFERAEDYLLAAFNAYDHEKIDVRPTCLHPHVTVRVFLGKLYRQTGRYEESIQVLEQALPIPGAFSELVSVLRFLGKAAKKDGDKVAWAEWYRRMYCLSRIHATVLELRVHTNTGLGIDYERGARWLNDVREQCGSIYVYQFDGREVPDDTLLSPADYKVQRESAGGSAS